jgi:hypothetical protein
MSKTEISEDDARREYDAMVEQLRVIARGMYLDERRKTTLQPTLIVNEGYAHLGLSRVQQIAFIREHGPEALLRRWILAMKNYLIDRAAAKSALKRTQPGKRVDAHDDAALQIDLTGSAWRARDENRTKFDAACELLRELDEHGPHHTNPRAPAVTEPNQAALAFEMRFLGEQQLDEIAKALNVSVSTAKNRINEARDWLRWRLEHSPQ